MQSMFRICRALVIGFTLSGCVANARSAPDELPMYGGLDRSANPALKSIDDKFILDVTKEFGSREKASSLFVEQGMRFYLADDYAKAMRRFNQAWLLNPNNPDVYWGFATIYHDQGRPCDAQKMIDIAIEHGLQKPIAVADAGRIITLCAAKDAALDEASKKTAFARSESMYEKANGDAPKNDYILTSWASAYYWRGDYSSAWKKVNETRLVGGSVPGQLVNLLRKKMPEPTQP
jgi:tetratricopeptide (TPR) repeat protein